MQVTFTIAAASYERMLQNVLEASPVYTLLKRVVSADRRRKRRLGAFNVVLLRCSREEVVPILAAAKQHCPQEIQEIERALWQGSPKGH